VCLHRAVLQRELFRKLDPGRVHFSSACTRIQQDPQGVTAYFSNGRSERGAILIGADGLRSVIREALFGSKPLRYLGHACYRGIVEFPVSILPAGYAFESWGPGQRFGAIRLDSERAYWFANLNCAQGVLDPNPGCTLQAKFAGWHEPIPRIVESAHHAPILRHEIYDLSPIKAWSSGRVSLLGDAAHPMTPDLGQGACQAIEDAVALAQSFCGAEDLVTALREYELRRWRRAAGIVKRSHFQAWIGQRSNPLACRVRDLLMRTSPAAFMERAYKINVDVDMGERTGL